MLLVLVMNMDYGLPEKKQPSLHSQKFNPNPKLLGTAEADLFYHIGPLFQISHGHEVVDRKSGQG